MDGRRYYQPAADGESPCARCVHNTPAGCECVAASYLCSVKNKRKSGPELRKWWLSHVRRVRPPETEAMRRGKEAHERAQREAGVTHDLDEVFDALSRVGGRVVWTSRLCTRYLGIRGEPDIIETSRPAPDRIYLRVTELKSHPNRRRSYWNQAVAYALMLSYRQLITDGRVFYDELPVDRSFSVDVDFKFRYYDDPSYVPKTFPLIRDWKFVGKGEGGFHPDGTPIGAEYVWGLKRTRRKFSGLLNVRRIEDIAQCPRCPPIDSRQSTLNGGKVQPSELCWGWPYCRDDLLAPQTKQIKLGRWVRRRKS